MKKQKINLGISELPDVIIQHIQSFLETKEATRTIILSKSWLRAWSTRPFLHFDCLDFFPKYSDDALISLIDTTLDSYVEQGLTILKLRLDVYVNPIQQRWLQLARQCNVIRLDLCSYLQTWEPTLWPEIFMTQSLQSLKVDCRDCELVLSRKDIKCCNLNTLNFSWVHIDYLTFLTIMSVCPLIEELGLFECVLVNPSNSGGFAGEFACLKTLRLISTGVNDEQLQTILSKTPKLEDLILIDCYKLVKPINLSSVSLKRIEIVKPFVQIVRNDAPNLRRLDYMLDFHHTKTSAFPITTPAKKGEVNVDIDYRDLNIDASWFHGLKDFLSKFAKSKVKFTLRYPNLMTFDFKVLRAISPLSPQHEVGTLRFKEWSKYLPILYAFFTICHPKIVLLIGRISDSQRASLREFYKDLNYRGNLECCNLDKNKCWRHYIMDAKLYYMAKNEQKRLDMTGLEIGSGIGEVITLALEWKSSD